MDGIIQMKLEHWPLALVGALVGVVAFLPLVAVLVPTVMRKREPSIAKGGLAVVASFVVLLCAFALAYLVAGKASVFLVVGEIAGFALVLLVVAIAVIMMP